MRKYKSLSYVRLAALLMGCCPLVVNAQEMTVKEPVVKNVISSTNQWNGKRVAFLGDSITDKIHVGTTKNYWQYLAEMLGLEPMVYGINGNQWNGVYKQAVKLKTEHAEDVDAIIIFAGTNDYNAGVPLGEWYSYADKETLVKGGKMETRKKRTLQFDESTFRGRINIAIDYLKRNFPTKQIILLTPIHRAFAHFSNDNIQPDESYCNNIGLYIDEYVSVVKEASNVWAVPVIDLNCISGLYPLMDEHAGYFHKADTDRLHPNAVGHYRMAKALAYQLLTYPADFE